FPYVCPNPEAKDSCGSPYTYVSKILPDGDRIFVSGSFDSLNSGGSSCVASLRTDSGTANAWYPVLQKYLDPEALELEYSRFEVLAMGLSEDTLYAAGDFEFVDRMPRRGFAAVDAN